MHVGGAHGHDKEPNFCQKLGAFDCGTNGVCEGGVCGSSRLEDHLKLTRGQCAYIINHVNLQWK